MRICVCERRAPNYMATWHLCIQMRSFPFLPLFQGIKHNHANIANSQHTFIQVNNLSMRNQIRIRVNCVWKQPILLSLPSQKSIKSGLEWTTKMEDNLRKYWEKIANFVEFPFGFQIFGLSIEFFTNFPAFVILDWKKVNISAEILNLANIFGVL